MDGEQWYGAGYGLGGAVDEDMERSIDLNEQLIRNKPATFFFRMNSDAMIEAGIHSGDVLIVDRSIKVTNGKIIVAVLNGELLVRRLQTTMKGVDLISENKRYGNIHIDEFSSYSAWGTVTYVIHPLAS
jgi:DNA polymerase V